jgi:ubiquinone/menaquinone biosynthesis C-methylase UbiE
MKHEDAVALIADAVAGHGGAWVDLGAGGGTFTRALAELLAADGRVYAVDRDADAVAALTTWATTHAPHVTAIAADLSHALDLSVLVGAPLDGILIANALHFIRDADDVLARFAGSLRTGGRVVLIEYDRRESSRWVPYPVPISRLPSLAAAAGLSPFTVTASRPSMYQGVLYAAHAERVGKVYND